MSYTYIRLLFQYAYTIDFCNEIKKEYQIDEEILDIRKIKKLIQDVFKIKGPRLLVKDLTEIDAGACIIIRDKKAVAIHIDKTLYAEGDVFTLYHSIAHEMRHVWQVKNGCDMRTPKKCTKENLLSFCEVDAEAFSGLFIALFFQYDEFVYLNNGIDFAGELSIAVDKRVREIEMDFVWSIVQYVKKKPALLEKIMCEE